MQAFEIQPIAQFLLALGVLIGKDLLDIIPSVFSRRAVQRVQDV